MSIFQSKTVGFKPMERNVFFHILTACNLSCQHCYINPEQHGSKTLPKETIDEWLKVFYSQEKETNIIFLGGEPTLHKNLAHAVKTANHLGYNSVTIDSNGFMFHDIMEKIRPEEAVLSFSLDGPTAEINDPIRGDGVFATCTENLKKAVEKGFDVSLIYTVSSMNLQALSEMPSLLQSLGVKRFFIQVIGIRGKSANSEKKLQLSPEEWLNTIPPVAEKTARLGVQVIFPKVFLGPAEKFECAGLAAENYFIFPNGRVYQCPLCEDFPVNSFRIENNRLVKNEGLCEDKFFTLKIEEGCVMNKLLQPGNISYDDKGLPLHRISCCLLKQEISKVA